MSSTRLIALVAVSLSLLAGWANGQWTAYNDCVYSTTTTPPQYGDTTKITTYNIGNGSPGPASGLLKNYATGAAIGVTVTLTQNGSVVWQPDPTSGGSDCNSGTPAYTTFGGIVDMHGVIYYGSTGWWVDVTFTGLNPAKTYEFTTSANRNGSSYTDRITRYTITNTDGVFTNASSAGTIVDNATARFNTGYNTVNGYIAKWTGITPGADGSFKVRAQADGTQNSAYSFDVFKLVELAPTALGVTTQGATAVSGSGGTLNGQLTDLAGQGSAQVFFRWGTSPGNLDQTTAPQTLSAPGAFQAVLSGLNADTAYYYQAAGTAGTLNGQGAVTSFYTGANAGLSLNGSTDYVTMGAAPGLCAASFTIECWFKRTGVGQTASSGSGGVTAVPLVCKGASQGDGSNIDANYFVGIRGTDNVLAADFEDMASGLNHPVAGVTAIQNDVWYHAAATFDNNTTTWRLYLNGEQEAELVVNATPRYDSIQHFGLGASLNSTGSAAGRFAGVLDEVRVWNYARSQAEIRSTINTEIPFTSGLLGRWGLNDAAGSVALDNSGQGLNGTITGGLWVAGAPFNINAGPDSPILIEPTDASSTTALNVPLTVQVSDSDSASLSVKFYGRKLSAAPRPSFTIIAVPDTQYYSESYPATFSNQIQWIVNNRQTLNIVYAGHEGDIVNVATVNQQWVNANNAISLYDTVPDLPFGLAIGNHDEDPNGSPSGTGYFNTWFPYTRYASRPWYGGHYGTNNDCHYILFSAGGMDFIAFHLKYDPTGPADALTWVGGLLQTYSNRRAILVTHSLLEVSGAWTGQGSTIYNALKGYPNLFLMLCGHNHGENRRADVYNNNTINTLLADYQSRSNGGDGWLRILEFVPDDDRVYVKTYSTTMNSYERDSDSEFTLDYDMGGADYVELGTVSDVASGGNATFIWPNLERDRTYQWYATVSDSTTTVASPAWSFTAVRPPTPEIGLSVATIDRSARITYPVQADTFTVRNAGPGTLNYTISDDADWLSVLPAGGASDGEEDTIDVGYDASGLAVGVYTATITVTSPDGWNSPQTIAVTLRIQTVKPDFDLDGDVDQDDFGPMQVCLLGSGISQNEAACQGALLDEDGDVDSNDVTVFRSCMAGPGGQVPLSCPVRP